MTPDAKPRPARRMSRLLRARGAEKGAKEGAEEAAPKGPRVFREIRERLLAHRRRAHPSHHAPIRAAERPPGEVLVASYNVHKCVGTDKRFDPARIAAVIGEMSADVVALQEADRRFGRRTGLLDAAAMEREMGLRFIPVSDEPGGHGWHGNALLLRRGEVTDLRRLALPGAEPRGALVVDLRLPAGRLRVVAAHLGLLRRCRSRQVQAILGVMAECEPMPTLLLGDLNEWRPNHRSSLRGLEAAFGPMPPGLPSFPSRLPLLALDRVIGRPHGIVTGMEVHESPLARIASDHLPLKAWVDLEAGSGALRQAA